VAVQGAAEVETRLRTLGPGTPVRVRVWRDGLALEPVLTRTPAAP
jgi:hypothetical protein